MVSTSAPATWATTASTTSTTPAGAWASRRIPTKISAIGGKFFFDDDQEFPDTQQVTFEYPGDGKPGSKRLLIYEQRLWSTNYPHNSDSGAEFYGTKGQMFLSRRGKIEVRRRQQAVIEYRHQAGGAGRRGPRAELLRRHPRRRASSMPTR